MINKDLKEALFKKIKISYGGLWARATKIKEKYPMTTDDAVYIIAHQAGIMLDRYLDLETLDRVRSLIQVVAPSGLPEFAKRNIRSNPEKPRERQKPRLKKTRKLLEEKKVGKEVAAVGRTDKVPVEIQESLEAFKKVHPDSKKVAFIMMQFGTTQAHRSIVKAIKDALAKHDIVGVRSDDKEYHDGLLYNVMTYMHGSGFGIAVFERIEAEKFNPNVSLEVGYMMASRKHVCILKDKTLKPLHADLIGKLYKPFDPQNPEDSIPKQITKWLKDKELID